jgi:hypothetical protein
MLAALPAVVGRYFDADAARDHDAVVALFTDTAVVEDEGGTWSGIDEIRAWRHGPASRYEYTTDVFGGDRIGDDEYRVTGRLTGNFPGAAADLAWRFTLEGDRIRRLHIGS